MKLQIEADALGNYGQASPARIHTSQILWGRLCLSSHGEHSKTSHPLGTRKKREHGQRRGKERVSTRCREGPQESTAMSRASADNCRLGSAAIAIVYELQKDPTLSLL